MYKFTTAQLCYSKTQVFFDLTAEPKTFRTIRMRHSVIMDSLSATHFQLNCFFMNAKSGEKGNITLTGVLSKSAIQAGLRPFTLKVRNRETASSAVLPSN